MIWKQIVGGLSVAVIAAVMARSLLISPAGLSAGQQPALDRLSVSQTDPKLQEHKAAACAAATPVLQAIGSQAPDGKEVLPESDGKTVLPADGKETLPPVAELVGQRTDSVDPGHLGPPIEFLNKTPSSPLLSPPSPGNVSGPVVSTDTKGPP